MSRAIEKDISASLEKGNPLEAYNQISEILNPATGVYELEILGKSHPLPPGTYVLKDGPAVGISKLALVQAFLVAHKILKEHMNEQAAKSEDELLAATSVALLLDPEHLTAANIRKRVIHRRLRELPFCPVVDYERHFVDTLLKSRLHRHTKSPTLWSHRRWLIANARGYFDPKGDILSTVMIAAERHPMNYVAWMHARWLMGQIAKDPVMMSDAGRPVLDAVKGWCLRHHTDTSGWSFLHYLLTLDWRPAESQDAIVTVYNEILDRVMTFRWANEAVWIFLRTLAASGTVGEDGLGTFMKAASVLKDAVSRDSQDWKTVDDAEIWCRQYERKSET